MSIATTRAAPSFGSDDRPNTSAGPDIQNAAARSYAQLESVVEFPVALRVTKEGLVLF
jgi:hypothetical protein